MKNIKFKTVINLVCQILFLAVIVVYIAMFINASVIGNNDADLSTKSVSLDGEYRGDNGKAYKLDYEHKFVNNNYKKVVFKGNIYIDKYDECVFFCMDRLWVDVKVNGTTLLSNRDSGSKITPGISVSYLYHEQLFDENGNIADVEITLENPYGKIDSKAYNDFFESIKSGLPESMYYDMFATKSGEIAIGIIIIFMGVLTFSLAGVLIRDLKYQNFTFALVAFFGGIYLLTDSIYQYLPLIFKNPLVCFIVDEGSLYFLLLSFLFYIRSYMKKRLSKDISTICISVTSTVTLLAFVLQIFEISDIMQIEWVLYAVGFPSVFICLFLLVKEFIKNNDIMSKVALLSFVPLVIAGIVELTNLFLDYMPERYAMRIGIFATIIIQLLNLVMASKRSYEESLNYEKMQSELLKSQVLIMISQIQPHFLYNSLTSIAMLCEKDPKRAKTATIEFADYLRGNMNSLKDNNPVPFETELKHLKTYLSLEKMRFGDDLNVEYDIQTTDFTIPSLTVQPLVENAVKHGVGMKEDGGTVTISTREYDDRYEVVVSDDGVGFDTTKPNPDTSRSHVGIENIKERISSMCHGEVTIESEVGKGTVSTIKIYKDNTED